MGKSKRSRVARSLLALLPLFALCASFFYGAKAGSSFSDSGTRTVIRFPDLLGRLFQQSAPVQLTLPVLTADPGQIVPVDLLINTAVASRAIQFELAFDPNVLRCESVVEGSFYRDWALANGASTLVFPQPTCDNLNGRVTVMGIIVIGGVGGPAGSGVVATSTFTAISPGISPLTLLNVVVADATPSGNPLPVDLYPGQVVVGPTPTIDLTITATPSATISGTLPASETPTPSATASVLPTASEMPTGTATLPPQISATPTPVDPSSTPNVSGTPSPIAPPSATSSATASLTPTADITPTPGPWSCENAAVNSDGIVNILDLGLIAQKMFQTGSPGWIAEDVSRDGVINVLDITTSGACMDELPTPTFTPTITPTPVPEAHIWIDPGSQTIANGQVFTIKLILDTIAPSRAAQFGLKFNPAVLRCNEVSEGAFYSAWAAAHGASTLVLPQGTCNNALGQVSVMGITVLGGSGGASGQGIVASFEFTALANGSSPLTLQEVIIANDNQVKSEALPLRITNGQVIVGSASQPTATSTLTPTRSATTTSTQPSSNNPTETRTPTRAPTHTATTGQSSSPTATFTLQPTSSSGSPQPSNTPPVSRTNTPSASGARIFFEPAQKVVASVGETFNVDVVIETDKKTRSAMMKITFNPSVLECLELKEGGFYKTWATANSGQTYLHPNPPVINNTNGTIQDFGITILLADVDPSPAYAGGPSGRGVFVTLTFRAKANGASQLQMQNVILGDDAAEPYQLAVTPQTGQVFVGITPTPTQQGAATATPTRTLPAGNTTDSPTTSAGSGQFTATPMRTVGVSTATPSLTSGAAIITPVSSNAGATVIPGSSAPATLTPITQLTVGIPSATVKVNISGTAVDDRTEGKSLSEEAMPGSAGSGLIDISAQLDSNGMTTEDVYVQNQDGSCALSIPIDTQALTADNYPLKRVQLNSLDPQILPPEQQVDLGSALCEYGPPGANFFPPAVISLAYNAENLPAGVRENSLTLLLYDESAGDWLPLESSVDQSNQTVSAEVDHFSIYAIQAVPAAFNWTALVVVSLFVEVVIGLGAVWYIRYRRSGAVRKAGGSPLLLPPISGGQYFMSIIPDETQQGSEWSTPIPNKYPRPSGTTYNPTKEN